MVKLTTLNPDKYSKEEYDNLMNYLRGWRSGGQAVFLTDGLDYHGKGLLEVICPIRDGKRELAVVLHKFNNYAIELPYSTMNDEEKRNSTFNNGYTKGLFPLNENNLADYMQKFDFNTVNIFATSKLKAKKASEDYVLPRFTQNQLQIKTKAELTALAESIAFEKRAKEKWDTGDLKDVMVAKLFVLIGIESV